MAIAFLSGSNRCAPILLKVDRAFKSRRASEGWRRAIAGLELRFDAPKDEDEWAFINSGVIQRPAHNPLASHSSCTMLSGIPFWGDSSEWGINENLIGKKMKPNDLAVGPRGSMGRREDSL